MSTFSTEAVTNVYREYCKIPSVTRAQFISNREGNDIVQLAVEWNQTDLEKSEKIKFINYFSISSSTLQLVTPAVPSIDVTTECLSSWTKCSQYRAVVRKTFTKSGEEKQFLEVWFNNSKTINIDIDTQEQHGKIYDDNQFGCLQWSDDAKQLLYVAEKKRPKTESFFKTSFSDPDAMKDSSLKDDGKTSQEDQYLFLEDWGEKFKGKCSPVICILSLETKTISVVNDFPNEMSVGQATWTPDGKGIVAVGWYHEPRRLGIAVCSNRRSTILYNKIGEAHYEIIGRTTSSVHSPRFSPDGKHLVYVETYDKGPHHNCSRLMMCQWPYSGSGEVIIDFVHEALGSSFPGLFLFLLPEHPWSSDSNFLIFHSHWRSREELICVNVATKKIIKLSQDQSLGRWNLLDMHNDLMVIACSSPNIKPFLMLGKFPCDPETEAVEWVKLSEDDQSISNLTWEILNFTPLQESINPKYPKLDFEVILMQPQSKDNNKKTPLIIWPHGGPHCCFTAEYNFLAALFVHLGFSVALINYRGSEGYGENNLRSLLGNVGVQDVADCKQTLDFLIKERGYDRESVVAFGGSHGGFLITHMIGQFPDHFKACVCRNPVTDITSCATVSDIPDWSWVEAGLEYNENSNSSPDVLKSMWEKSPMRYIDEVRTPTLLLMGKLDQRVPPSQSLLFYHALKSRKIPVRMNVYEDGHSLNKPEVEANSFIHTYLWFKKYLQL